MGTSPYYAIPYPESTDAPDGPTQMRAIADRVEALLKNGFTMPTGDLIIGDVAATTQRMLHLKKIDAGSAIDSRLYVPSGGGLILEVLKAGAPSIAVTLHTTGAITTVYNSVTRPMPFAMFTANQSVPTGGGGSAITLPTGRFTVAPTCFANIYGTSAYHAMVAISTSTSITMVHNSTVSATCDAVAIQMTPTSAPGLRTLPEGVVYLIATCHTPGCANADHPIDVVTLSADTPITCGVCSEPITDIVEGPPADDEDSRSSGSEDPAPRGKKQPRNH